MEKQTELANREQRGNIKYFWVNRIQDKLAKIYTWESERGEPMICLGIRFL